MAEVKLLEKSVAERIAAGEVVERPVSVIKELVENSLDAASSRITVEIKGGGITEIKITDNGCGMSREDVQLAICRFATSKIRQWEDMDSLCTLGFRGEALPSIAAVSRLTIRTCREGDEQGTELYVEGAGEPAVKPAAARPGTCITCADLFYNTPARLKFLRSPAAETAQITDMLGRLAVTWPEVAFRLVSNGKEVFSFPAGVSAKQRLASVWKLDSDDLLPVCGEYKGMMCEGWVAKPKCARSNRNSQLFLLNGRVIRSQNLSQALLEGFSPLVERGRFPVGMLRLTVNPSDVDVNVHPNKLEVRFADPRPVFTLVYRSVAEALEAHGADSVKPGHLEKALADSGEVPADFGMQSLHAEAPAKGGAHAKDSAPAEGEATAIGGAPAEPLAQCARYKERNSDLSSLEKFSSNKPSDSRYSNTLPYGSARAYSREALRLYEPLPGTDELLEKGGAGNMAGADIPCGAYEAGNVQDNASVAVNASIAEPAREAVSCGQKEQGTETAEDNLFSEDELPEANSGQGRFVPLAQLHNTFIAGLVDGELWVIDQHTAHERINYEHFGYLRAISERSQGLLIPEVFEFSPATSAFLLDSLELFEEYGFQAEPFGDNTFRLCGVPAGLSPKRAVRAFQDLAEELAGGAVTQKRTVSESLRERMRAMISCKSSVRAGDPLTFTEMKQLVEKMLSVEHSRYCPHGRPTRIILDKKALERLFHR